ncbi:MAG: hypothetical protein KF834_07320 [Burkholderiales bacterium]|nr:hypothetical protein [Burkholderiales bacterium]
MPAGECIGLAGGVEAGAQRGDHAPGAAPDKTARLIRKLWQTQRIYEGPLSVVNKPGGAGPAARRHRSATHALCRVQGQRGFGHRTSRRPYRCGVDGRIGRGAKGIAAAAVKY